MRIQRFFWAQQKQPRNQGAEKDTEELMINARERLRSTPQKFTSVMFFLKFLTQSNLPLSQSNAICLGLEPRISDITSPDFHYRQTSG